MPGPDPQPPPPTARPRRATTPFAPPRAGCLWLVLVPITAAVVAQAVSANHPRGWDALARRAPRLAADALVHFVIGLGAAVILHALLRRGAVWVALAAVAMASYPAWTRWADDGRATMHVRTWVPFVVLLGLGAMHAIPRPLREAAAVDRAGPWFAFRTITLPLAAPLLLLGAALLTSVTAHALDARQFAVAHALLALAIVGDALLGRSRR